MQAPSNGPQPADVATQSASPTGAVAAAETTSTGEIKLIPVGHKRSAYQALASPASDLKRSRATPPPSLIVTGTPAPTLPADAVTFKSLESQTMSPVMIFKSPANTPGATVIISPRSHHHLVSPLGSAPRMHRPAARRLGSTSLHYRRGAGGAGPRSPRSVGPRASGAFDAMRRAAGDAGSAMTQQGTLAVSAVLPSAHVADATSRTATTATTTTAASATPAGAAAAAASASQAPVGQAASIAAPTATSVRDTLLTPRTINGASAMTELFKGSRGSSSTKQSVAGQVGNDGALATLARDAGVARMQQDKGLQPAAQGLQVSPAELAVSEASVYGSRPSTSRSTVAANAMTRMSMMPAISTTVTAPGVSMSLPSHSPEPAPPLPHGTSAMLPEAHLLADVVRRAAMQASHLDISCRWSGCASYMFTDISGLAIHIEQHIMSLDSRATGGVSTKRVCRWIKLGSNVMCGASFTSSSDLRTHLRAHTGERPYACRFQGCSQEFPSQEHLDYHELLHQPHTVQEAVAKAPMQGFRCPHALCGKMFERREDLGRHSIAHSKPAAEDKPHKCDYPGCNKSYTRRAHLVHHRYIHEGKRPFLCSVPGCDASFVRPNDLRRHNRMHTGEKKYKCKIRGCNMSFTRRDNLTYHLARKHSDATLTGLTTGVMTTSNALEMTAATPAHAAGADKDTAAGDADTTGIATLADATDMDAALCGKSATRAA